MKSVLSIDFDYFQDVSEDIIKIYPDGIDLSSELSSIVWSTRYADPRQKILMEKIKPLYNELKILKDILEKQSPFAKVLVSRTHLDIYQFIWENVSIREKFKLHNIDMHHDFLNENDFVDCGNWLGYIFEGYEKNIYFQWIANPISLNVYGFDLPERESLSPCVKESLEAIKYEQYDYIFLCRSDAWLPPHLDDEFNNVLELIKAHFKNVSVKSEVQKPRDYKSYTNDVSDMFDMIYDLPN